MAHLQILETGIVPPSLPKHNLLCFHPLIPKIVGATLLEYRGISAIHVFLV